MEPDHLRTRAEFEASHLCDGCVSCVCSAAPSCDEDGLCVTCGGWCVALAARSQDGRPHPDLSLDAEHRTKALALIAEFLGPPA